MPIIDISSRICDQRFCQLLAAAMYAPTPARVLARAQHYIEHGYTALAYLLEGEPLGIVVFSLNESRAEIVNISTAVKYRKRGIARSLIGSISAKYDVREIYAETDDDAVGFYARCGFLTEPCRVIDGIQRYACVLSVRKND